MKAVKKKVKLSPKDKATTVYIRNVGEQHKKKFVAKAKTLGYKPRELFEEMVKSL